MAIFSRRQKREREGHYVHMCMHLAFSHSFCLLRLVCLLNHSVSIKRRFLASSPLCNGVGSFPHPEDFVIFLFVIFFLFAVDVVFMIIRSGV